MNLDQLTAVEVPATAEVDLLDDLSADSFVFLGNDRSIRTDGVALRIAVAPGADRFLRAGEEVASVLSGLSTPEELRNAPIAVGALPFSDALSGELIVPQRIVVRDGDGSTSITFIGDPITVATRTGAVGRQEPATSYSLENDCSYSQWEKAIERARQAIVAGELDKVVLARSALVTSDVEFDLETVLRRLKSASVDAFIFAAAGFIGASPELLVARCQQRVLARPMAGTIERAISATSAPTTTETRQLAESAKDNEEHRIVVEDVLQALAPYCTSLHVDGPNIRGFSAVAHLVSEVEGVLKKDAPSALGLLHELHPTPAVAGRPRGRALELISELEPTDRGLYAGPVGWVDANGDGEFAIALRCAAVKGNTARLYAGAGILSASTARGEWNETGAKFEPALRALVRL